MKHRVLLAVRPRLFRESLNLVLRRSPHVDVVDAGSAPLDLLLNAREWAPAVLVESWPAEEPSTAKTAVSGSEYGEPSDLRIIRVTRCNDRRCLCQHRFCLKVLREPSLNDVLGEVLRDDSDSGRLTFPDLLSSPHRSP